MSICVTGGSSGIGRAIAERFSTPGNDVFINYHAAEGPAEETAAAVRRLGAEAHLVKADIGSPAGVALLFEYVAARVDRLDQLVHAAVLAEPGPLLGFDQARLVEILEVNSLALVQLVRSAGDLLGEGSSVVYVTSRGSEAVIRNYGSLGISKALGEHIVRHLAVELGPSGVRVNAVSPGPLQTTAFQKMFPRGWEKMLAAAEQANPSGRGLEFEDVAAVVEALSSSAFAMVQGQVVMVDGGLSLAQ